MLQIRPKMQGYISRDNTGLHKLTFIEDFKAVMQLIFIDSLIMSMDFSQGLYQTM